MNSVLKLKFNIIAFALCLISSINYVHASTPLSDIIPTDIVSRLMDIGLWKNSFDDEGDGEGQDLKQFWNIVNSNNTTNDHIVAGVNSLRGTMESEEIISHYPELYRIKIMFLRHSKDNGKRSANLIHTQWSQTYEELALKVLKFSGVTEYEDLISSYNSLKASGEITFKDLDPSYRSEMVRYDRNSHELSIESVDPRTSLYKVNGVYNAQLKVFAVDLSRSINETLITFAHELVHAADTEISQYRSDARILYPQILSIIYGWVGSNRLEAEQIAKDLLNHVLYETSSVEVIEHLRQLRQQKIQQLNEDIDANPSSFEPTAQEMEIINQFFTAVIGQTVINEYRAYGLSLAVYLKLKNDKRLLPPSRERKLFIEQFMSGDEIFAVNLANDFNPFKSYESTQFAALIVRTANKSIDELAREAEIVISPELRQEMTESDVLSIENRKKRAQDTLNFMKALQVLERSYLTTLDLTLRTLNNRFSRYFRDIEANISDDILPPWARPGGFTNQLHPYQILTARLTTAWVLRFRRNLELIHNEIKDLSEPLVNMHLGILDLSDVSNGERELIGIKYKNRSDGAPVSLPSELQIGINEIPNEIKDHFERVEYRLDPSSYRSNPIRKSEVLENLVKLRLLKSLVWIDKSFLNWEATLVQSFNFLELLQTGRYDQSQLSRERAEELENELKVGLSLSQGSRDELELTIHLLITLGDLYRIADESEWSSLYSALLRKRNSIITSLEQFAIYNNISREEFSSMLDEEKRKFDRMIARSTYQDSCDRDWRRNRRNKASITFYSSGSQMFEVRGRRFPLSMICNQKKLHLVRQPGDSTRSMTSLYEMRNGMEGVTIRVFNGTRAILLD